MVGFEKSYEPQTEDTPLAVLASSSAFVFVLLAVVVTLITRRSPLVPKTKQKHQASDTSNEVDDHSNQGGDSNNKNDKNGTQVERISNHNVPAAMKSKNGSPIATLRTHPEEHIDDTNSQDPLRASSTLKRTRGGARQLDNSAATAHFPKEPQPRRPPSGVASSTPQIPDTTTSSPQRPQTSFSAAKGQTEERKTLQQSQSYRDPQTQQQQQQPHEANNNVEAPPFPRPLRSWDLMSSAAMRFRHGHFSGRSVQRLVQQERHAHEISGEGSSYSRSAGSWNSRRTSISKRGGGSGSMSESANQVLGQQTVEGEADYYRQRYRQKSAAQRQQQQQQQQQQQIMTVDPNNPSHTMSNASLRRIPFRRGPMSSATGISRTSSGRSRMPALDSDVLSPQDAADAFDPGQSLPDNDDDDDEWLPDNVPPVGAADNFCGNLLDLAEPDLEVRRILSLAAPSTLGAMAEPCFRLGVVVIISHFIDTDSMIAFVLVILFVRITTEELSGAITDAESSLLHQALSLGGDEGFELAGRQMQLAILMQLLMAVPILIAWALVMDYVVSWLIPENDRIGDLAQSYTQIIVIDYALQAASRTFFLVFHMTGQANFELLVDLIGIGVTIVSIALIASFTSEPTLDMIGWIQVGMGILKVLIKVGIVSSKGLLKAYRQGLIGSFSLRNRQAVWAFCGTTFPLLLGSLIELREWEILVLFTKHLGGAEVATWALMGIIWEIFEASTEGLGEAAAVRVSLVLSDNLPELARQLAHKAVLLCIIEALLITAAFLMLGRNLSVALTHDNTLQTLFNDLVGVTGLANVAMSLAQVYWSLLGSQGRFGAASSSILLCRWLLTMPLAAVYIFAADYDLRAVGSALAVGYMTATGILAWRLHKSDWKLYAKLAKEEAMPGEEAGLLDDDDYHDEEEDDEDLDFDDESSDSTGFG